MAGLLFLNLVMLTRLGYLTRETPATAGAATLMAALQLLALAPFARGWPVLALGAVIVAVNVLNHLLERRGHHLAGARSLSFGMLALAAALLLDDAALAPWSEALFGALASATRWTDALPPAAWQHLNLLVFAFLLLTNEVNLVIRYGFYRLNLEPKLEQQDTPSAATTDQTQYNAGRVIGILERYFTLIVLLGGADYAAIAVILAAKGFARFKQLDRREFAEYVLIGTLASMLSAVVTATLVNRLLA